MSADTFTWEQESPSGEVKQPGEGVEYRAQSPSHYEIPGDDDDTMPPGNPGFPNLPDRDSMNPSSGKVIPNSMKQDLQQSLTYAITARVVERFGARVAVTIPELLQKTGPQVHVRSKSVQIKAKKFDRHQGFWSWTATGSQGQKYIVRLKGWGRRAKGKGDLSKAKVRCSCTCNFWRWQGPEHWAKSNGYLYRSWRAEPQGTMSKPVVRDPKGKHWLCKHLVAALTKAKTFKFASASEWSFEGEVVPWLEPDPFRVAQKFADLAPPLGFPGGLCYLIDRIHREIRNPRLREELIEDIERGQILDNSETSKVYDAELERGVGRFKDILITAHAQSGPSFGNWKGLQDPNPIEESTCQRVATSDLTRAVVEVSRSKDFLPEYCASFSGGGCFILARALGEVTGKPLVGICSQAWVAEEGPQHIAVRISPGKLLDAKGIRSDAEVLREIARTGDKDEIWYVCPLKGETLRMAESFIAQDRNRSLQIAEALRRELTG